MPIEVSPITATLGAEVTGVDMANVDGVTLDQLKKAWLDHKVLVLRDQHITTEEHIAFGRLFGELETHPFATGRRQYPEIVKIKSTSEHPYAAARWHSDVTWRQEPSMGSILRGVVIPPAGGDTCFADAAAAYELLPLEFKAKMDKLFAIHDFTQTFGRHLSAEERAEKQKEYPPARHPVIRTHPETGQRSIYTNRAFVSYIEGVDSDESERIIDRLERAIMNPTVQCRIRWDVDTFVMWDNRAVQHFGTDDFYPATRHVERVTVIGERPF
ncbi:MAG: taurine dioxygenase [Acidimicrobiaceae bacterium]|nr:taurine dioxygenase [Acidimicrobiaceae bacterium]MXW75402.1 taurine dioxygenase [Acidimicrobiaceae bacterium]MYA75854.1 taurine dioxygenase [Acidimicrobiaceae bacterium]MYC41772.1 taurine dioxygenase [Acidimicrobiaceae bacterium]MYD07015.1 taurine dioxygenase [Acidimicrobiaceae bacterium]